MIFFNLLMLTTIALIAHFDLPFFYEPEYLLAALIVLDIGYVILAFVRAIIRKVIN